MSSNTNHRKKRPSFMRSRQYEYTLHTCAVFAITTTLILLLCVEFPTAQSYSMPGGATSLSVDRTQTLRMFLDTTSVLLTSQQSLLMAPSTTTSSSSSSSRRNTLLLPLSDSDRKRLFQLSHSKRNQRGRLGFSINDSEDNVVQTTNSRLQHATVDQKEGMVWKTQTGFLRNKASGSRVGSIWKTLSPLGSASQASLSTSATPLSSNTFPATSYLPSWFPWLPTRQQIDSLTVPLLKQALDERDVMYTARAKKEDLQEILYKFTMQQKQVMEAKRKEWNTWNQNSLNLSGKTRQAKTKTTTSSTEFSSLGEWTRTVDLKPLFQRRQDIQREKIHGKPKPQEAFPQVEPKPSTIFDLERAFDKAAPPTNNVQIQDLYEAAKDADKKGDTSRSKQLVLQLLTYTPNDARLYRRLARLEANAGDIGKARQVIHQGLILQPKNAYLWHGLATYASDRQQAKMYYQKAIRCDPSFAYAYHALGVSEHTHGHVASAMKILKEGVKQCPTNHRLHHALGDLYRDAKLLDMAETCYRRSLQHLPNENLRGYVYTALAFVSYEKGNVNACRAWLTRAVGLNKGKAGNSWIALAQMEESEGNIPAARAVYIAGLAHYERNLAKKTKSMVVDPKQLKNDFMKSVPVYRSGDRFFQVYRSWCRFEERHGSPEAVTEIYQRCRVAFPNDYRIAMDAAQYNIKQGLFGSARSVFMDACAIATRHADPHRLYAEYEMHQSNFQAARQILYRGASTVTQNADGSSQCGLAELFYTWAVCEWHLGELARAENLFDHALRMTDHGPAGKKLRSLILYAIAHLEHYRGEDMLAQHCIGLCLKENGMPNGNLKVWQLWADVASSMGNDSLARQCQDQVERALSPANTDANEVLSRLVGGTRNHASVEEMTSMLRLEPWHHKLFEPSLPFVGPTLPEKNNQVNGRHDRSGAPSDIRVRNTL
jgi:tetratricopeptide (TPR) repeat protein